MILVDQQDTQGWLICILLLAFLACNQLSLEVCVGAIVYFLGCCLWWVDSTSAV